jgi:hypothetical protein
MCETISQPVRRTKEHKCNEWCPIDSSRVTMSESYQHSGCIASTVDRSSCVSQCLQVRRASCSRVQPPDAFGLGRLPTLKSHARDGFVLELAYHLWDAEIEPPTKVIVIVAAGTLIFCRRRRCCRQHSQADTHRLPRSISLLGWASVAVWIMSGCQYDFPRCKTVPTKRDQVFQYHGPGECFGEI